MNWLKTSPLRALVNGQVIGVPESFYDFQIRNQLTNQPIIEAYLIGNILNKYPKDINATINMYKNDHIKMYKINST